MNHLVNRRVGILLLILVLPGCSPTRNVDGFFNQSPYSGDQSDPGHQAEWWLEKGYYE
jgi:hypothetical protein|tara:strand:+ start:579 stop:752 length:174 start_codon:yes stop_codon:yes gene_type:complete